MYTAYAIYLSSTWRNNTNISRAEKSKVIYLDSVKETKASTDLGLDHSVIQQTPQWREPDSRLMLNPHLHTPLVHST